MEIPLILRLLSSSVKISYKAGSIVRQVMSSGNLGVVDKGVNDLQTRADRQAQACIIGSLQKRFPGICVIGEETLEDCDFTSESQELELGDDDNVLLNTCPFDLTSVELKDIVVWVDPLDGTSEYTQGLLEHVTVLIGLSVCGIAVGGVIHQPYSHKNVNEGRSIFALKGMGCFGFEKRFNVNDLAPSKILNVVTTTRSHGSDNVNDALKSCEPTEIIRVGGCGHKVLLLLEGRCHAYIFASAGCKKWDTCAPEAVLHEAGGYLTDLIGRPLTYEREVQRENNFGVLATAKKEWHGTYLNKIPSSIKEELIKAN